MASKMEKNKKKIKGEVFRIFVEFEVFNLF